MAGARGLKAHPVLKKLQLTSWKLLILFELQDIKLVTPLESTADWDGQTAVSGVACVFGPILAYKFRGNYPFDTRRIMCEDVPV